MGEEGYPPPPPDRKEGTSLPPPWIGYAAGGTNFAVTQDFLVLSIFETGSEMGQPFVKFRFIHWDVTNLVISSFNFMGSVG